MRSVRGKQRHLVAVTLAVLGVCGGLAGVATAGVKLRSCSGTAVGGRYHDLRVAHITCVVGRRVMSLRARFDDHHKGGSANPLGLRCRSVRITPNIEAFRDTCSNGSRTVVFVVSA